MTEQELECQIVASKLTAPRITPDYIDGLIRDVKYHMFDGTTTTVCLITLENGFSVVGESACASPENFKKEIGEQIAFTNAREKIWVLAGYHLKQQLHEGVYAL